MKVAFFANTILEHAGGFEKYLTETSAALSVRYPDLEITIVTFNEKRTEMLQRLLTVYYFKKMPIRNIYREKTENVLARLGSVKYVKCQNFKEVRNILRKQDIIYAKNEIIDLAILRSFFLTKLPPIIAGVHTPIDFPSPKTFHAKLHNLLYKSFLYRFLLRQASAVHVINESAQHTVEEGGFVGKIYKIANPFLSASFSSVPNGDGDLRLLMVGRISNEKGCAFFLRCIKMLLMTDVGQFLKVKIAGMGDEALVSEMEDLSKKYPQIEYVGYVQNEHVNELYNWTDLVILPSYFETMPYIVLETGASGKIILASDIPGPRDMIINEVTGFLLPLDERSFVEKIRELYQIKLHNNDAFLALGTNARNHVNKNFNPERIYQELDGMLRESAMQHKIV